MWRILGILTLIICLGVTVGAVNSALDIAFPLPLKHSIIARQAQDLSTSETTCPQAQALILIARFTLQGSYWVFAYAPDTQRYMFVQYAPGNKKIPLRVFLGKGSDDTVVITQVIEDPSNAVPGGLCMLLYPVHLQSVAA